MLPDPSSVKSLKQAVSPAFKKFEDFQNDELLFELPDFFQHRIEVSKRLCLLYPSTGLHYIDKKQTSIKRDISNCLATAFSKEIFSRLDEIYLSLLKVIEFINEESIMINRSTFQDFLKKLIVPYLFIPAPESLLKTIISTYDLRLSPVLALIIEEEQGDLIDEELYKSFKLLKINIEQLFENYFEQVINTILSTIPKLPSDMSDYFSTISGSVILEVWEYSLNSYWLDTMKDKLKRLPKKRYFDEAVLQKELIIERKEKFIPFNGDEFSLILRFDSEPEDNMNGYNHSEWRRKILRRAFSNLIPPMICQAYGLDDNKIIKDEVQTDALKSQDYPYWKIIWTRGKEELDKFEDWLIQNDLLLDDSEFQQLFICNEGKLTGSDLNNEIPIVKVKSIRLICTICAIFLKYEYISDISAAQLKKTLSKSLMGNNGKQVGLGAVREYFTKYFNKGYSAVIAKKYNTVTKRLLKSLGITIER